MRDPRPCKNASGRGALAVGADPRASGLEAVAEGDPRLKSEDFALALHALIADLETLRPFFGDLPHCPTNPIGFVPGAPASAEDCARLGLLPEAAGAVPFAPPWLPHHVTSDAEIAKLQDWARMAVDWFVAKTGAKRAMLTVESRLWPSLKTGRIFGEHVIVDLGPVPSFVAADRMGAPDFVGVCPVPPARLRGFAYTRTNERAPLAGPIDFISYTRDRPLSNHELLKLESAIVRARSESGQTEPLSAATA